MKIHKHTYEIHKAQGNKYQVASKKKRRMQECRAKCVGPSSHANMHRMGILASQNREKRENLDQIGVDGEVWLLAKADNNKIKTLEQYHFH